MSQLLQMLQLQQELNDTTNGLNWEAGITKNGKLIDWRRCIYLEAAELIDSYPWKHWKNIDASPDYENIKIELVDIWHFVMSEALRLYKIEQRGTIEELAQRIQSLQGFQQLTQKNPQPLESEHAIKEVEKMLGILFCNQDIDTLTDSFLETASKLGLDLDALYALYIGKNILNKFRQDHGYKEGTYIKVWNNEEDNVIMQRLLQEDPTLTPKSLYQALQAIYPQSKT